MACACLVALGVGPSWFKPRTTKTVVLLLAGMGLIVATALHSPWDSGVTPDAARAGKPSPGVVCSALIISRRFATLLIRQQWIKTLSHYTDCKKAKISFLSPPADSKDLIRILIDGGPLGPGCGKLVEVCVGLVCLYFAELYLPILQHLPRWALYCDFGPLWPNWWLPTCVVLLSFAVNVVLWIWSTIQRKSRGAHEGVHRMVRDTMHRKLSSQEHVLLVTWSFINALCEEISSRGFNRWEFSIIEGSEAFVLDDLNLFLDPSNLWQAATFGLSHFYGVPSGWTGVLLTFVYGWLMGILQNAGHGLLYPILAHTMADYFIFSQIARRQ